MTDVATTKHWYIVHTYSGFEKKVAESLGQRVQAYGLQEDIGEILIPTEDVVEMRAGRKVVTPKRFFPGYILVEMNMTDHAWHVVKNTPKVTGFVGAGVRPTPLTKEEVDQILEQVKTAAEKPKPKYTLREGRSGPHQRGPVHQLQRRGRRSEHGQEHAQGDGDHLRTGHAGGAGFLAGGEDLARLQTTGYSLPGTVGPEAGQCPQPVARSLQPGQRLAAKQSTRENLWPKKFRRW